MYFLDGCYVIKLNGTMAIMQFYFGMVLALVMPLLVLNVMRLLPQFDLLNIVMMGTLTTLVGDTMFVEQIPLLVVKKVTSNGEK
jgi:hypothetical protein